MSKISVTVVADSLSPQEHRITSIEAVLPRFVLAELNTHRMFSRNSASSRAIPFSKMVQMVKENPFIPIAWQKDHKGMQGVEYLTNDLIEIRNEDTNEFKMVGRVDLAVAQHLCARDNVIEWATNQYELGVTKQLCNRYLEPFMWHKVLITATEWENFFALRCPQYVCLEDKTQKTITYRSKKDYINNLSQDEYDRDELLYKQDEFWQSVNEGQAEIHMMALAEAIWDAMNESTPRQLQAGEWHIPYEDKVVDMVKSWDGATDYHESREAIIKVSTAMAARVSYTTVGDEKEISYERLIGIHDRIISAKPSHSSPTEHCAMCMTDEEYNSNIIVEDGKTILGVSRNFRGFKQYRQILGI